MSENYIGEKKNDFLVVSFSALLPGRLGYKQMLTTNTHLTHGRLRKMTKSEKSKSTPDADDQWLPEKMVEMLLFKVN